MSMARKNEHPERVEEWTARLNSSLRLRAETLLAQRDPKHGKFYERDLEEIIHELATYQIELELQNEDLKSAQAKLDASRQKYVDLYDHAPIGYFTFNPAGKIVAVNLTGAAMLGRFRSDLRQTPFSLFVAEGDRDTFFLHLRRTVLDKKKQSVELELLNNDGRPLHVLLDSVPVQHEEGKTAEVWTTVTDISEKKQKEQEIMDLNQELNRSNEDLLHFTFIVSHDLQEPLRTISSFVQLLEKRYTGLLDDKGRLFMRHIVDGTEYMHNLLSDLLLYSRVGGAEKVWKPVKLNRILEVVRKNLAEKFTASGGYLLISTPLSVVYGDEFLYTTLLQNLVDNSLKYRSEKEPRIHISAERDGDKWLFSVRDNGIGLDPQYADKIFLIFQRLHKRDKYPGTGIGLALCRKIVERYGGKIWVESEPGRGATFYFTLPTERNGWGEE